MDDITIARLDSGSLSIKTPKYGAIEKESTYMEKSEIEIEDSLS